jgi:serine/threonine protein kinase
MVNLVVEYMDGGSLQDVVDNGGCQDEEALADIAYQVLLGLDFLHSNQQMHRDIKPGNILLNCEGVVKLADFGISKAVDTKSGFMQPNSFVGTMCYMVSTPLLSTSVSLSD